MPVFRVLDLRGPSKRRAAGIGVLVADLELLALVAEQGCQSRLLVLARDHLIHVAGELAVLRRAGEVIDIFKPWRAGVEPPVVDP